MNPADWWRGSVIYQIYPRSFLDSNGDGIGDLPGITAKLNYVAELGVDAVWLAPFFRSPMKDFGYDVTDYRAVDPLFGTLADFDRLVQKAHELGLKIIIDQVLSHTSDEHPWFQESRRSRDNPKADWYVWADPKPDGTPPNNWLSIFGGPAWQWEPRRHQYYLHNFLVSQPDLNFHNPAVIQQLLDEVEFWLKRGVDGFRLDAINFSVHDRQLRDNPPWDQRVKRADGISLDNPYAYQRHLYDKTRPEVIAFLRRLRQVLDRYPGTTTVGEIQADDALPVMAEYTAGNDKLHMAYCFELLTQEFSAGHIRTIIERLEEQIGDGWPCWSLGNHDVTRVLTRWGGEHPPAALAKVLMAMLLSLRGSVCIYQGEELGLTEADLPFAELQDPYGIAFWPEFKGRDGCRTPLPWKTTQPHAGFSQAEPWLPIPEQHRNQAVESQVAKPDSVLNAYRRFIRWRREQTALRLGDIHFIEAPKKALAFIRTYQGERIVAAFNLFAEPLSISVPSTGQIEPLTGHGLPTSPQAPTELPGYGVFFGRLTGQVVNQSNPQDNKIFSAGVASDG